MATAATPPSTTTSALLTVHEVLALHCPGLPWTPSRRRALEERVRLRRLAAGATLFAQGDVAGAMYGVLAGEVDLRFSTADGRGSVVERAPAGYLFGLASFATGLASSYEAVAVTATRLAVIGPPAYDWLMDEVPGFGRALLRHFATRHDSTMRMLASSRHQGAEARLAHALRQAARASRVTREGAGVYAGAPAGGCELAITQAELADRAGLSRQTANEWLADWARRGWIEPRYGRLVVHRWPDADDTA
jgi:CRP-like cAMP-binding protein